MTSYLHVTHPQLRVEFVHILDKYGHADLAITFDMLNTFSNRVAIWKCTKTICENKCQHVFKTSVHARTRPRPSGCPYCCIPAKLVCSCNSFKGKYPSLVSKYWDTEANVGKDSEKMSPHSHIKCNFKCTDVTCDHHKWLSTPHALVQGKGCPYCASQKFCECYCLATEASELIEKEWDYNRNLHLDIWSLGPHSDNKAWWICQRCQNEWEARIDHRTRYASGCPKCKTSKMENNMLKVLKCLQKKQVITHVVYKCHELHGTRYEADFLIHLIDGSRIIVEMDGIQHFYPKDFGSKKKKKEDMFQDIQCRDQGKKEWCAKNNVRLLRISYLVKIDDYEAEVLDFICHSHVAFRIVGLPHE